MRKFTVNFSRTQNFSVDVTFMEDDKDEMDAVQIAMSLLDQNEDAFITNEKISHDVEEIELE